MNIHTRKSLVPHDSAYKFPGKRLEAQKMFTERNFIVAAVTEVTNNEICCISYCKAWIANR